MVGLQRGREAGAGNDRRVVCMRRARDNFLSDTTRRGGSFTGRKRRRIGVEERGESESVGLVVLPGKYVHGTERIRGWERGALHGSDLAERGRGGGGGEKQRRVLPKEKTTRKVEALEGKQAS